MAVGAGAACIVVLVSACGGDSRLSAAQYTDRLTVIGQEANEVQRAVAKIRNAKSVAAITKALTTFADAEQKLSDEVAGLKPPKDAEAANDELAGGLRHTADAVRGVTPLAGRTKSAQVSLLLVTHSGDIATAGQEIDHALAVLKELGYFTG